MTLKALSFTFFFDCGPAQGCVVVLPGSHRVQFAWNPHWGHDKDYETMGSDGMLDSDRPTFVRFSCKVGTVVMYDNETVYNALPNTTKEDRCALLTSYIVPALPPLS
jgi:ectoine hydroxylase-related dioxygenase (phytanoyl-CoA dioxygenase family)